VDACVRRSAFAGTGVRLPVWCAVAAAAGALLVGRAKQAKDRRFLAVLMSDPFPPSQTRIYLNPPPVLRALGCGGCGFGCLILGLAVFVLGGLFGILMFGWKTLLGG
jgi:hypothetical protein